MNEQEKQELYRVIKQALVAPFPEGTVENSNKPSHASIPVQAYIQRLEEAAGNHWSWKTIGDPVLYAEEDQIQVKGVLKILDAEREGIGFSTIQRFPDTNKIKNLKHAVLSAESDALRKACDKFQMGWVDLAPYRKWASNPALGFQKQKNKIDTSTEKVMSSEECVKCKNKLTLEEVQFLRDNQIRINFCKKDIPEQLMRKR